MDISRDSVATKNAIRPGHHAVSPMLNVHGCMNSIAGYHAFRTEIFWYGYHDAPAVPRRETATFFRLHVPTFYVKGVAVPTAPTAGPLG